MCKRFRRLFFEQPSLWRSFRVAFACHPDCYVEAKHALLRRVAPLVHDFVLLSNEEQACNRKATDFFGLLPDSLPGLQLRYECTAVPPAVRRLLRRLSLSGVLLPATLPDALTGLPQLEQLELSIYQCFDPARIMAAVAQLGRLTQLQLYSWGSARLHPPPPAAFPRLTTYTFHSAKFPVKVSASCWREVRDARCMSTVASLLCLVPSADTHGPSDCSPAHCLAYASPLLAVCRRAVPFLLSQPC